jgi:hypothetical protein
MQKIDYVKSFETIVEELKSREIVEKFDSGFAKVNDEPVDYSILVPVIFESKSNYDRLIMDKRYSFIINGLNANEIYSAPNLASVTAPLVHKFRFVYLK